MTERPALIWAVQSFAQLREPGRLRSLGAALEGDPNLAFTHVGRSFPPNRRIKGSLAETLGSYEGRLDPNQPEMWFFARQETPVGDGDLYIADDQHLELNMPHTINAGFQDADWFKGQDRLGMLAARLTFIADAAGAFYAYCVASDVFDQRAKLLERNAESLLGRLFKAGRVAEDLRRELPDVYWWNFFGPAFVKKWDGRLDGLGFRQESTPGGARVIWATETPFVLDPDVKGVEDYVWKEPFYVALGQDTFMRGGQSQRAPGEAVPDFNEHRVAAGARKVYPSRLTAGTKIMPRIARLRELSPGEAEAVDARAELVESEGLDVQLAAARVVPIREVAQWLENRTDRTVHVEEGILVYRNPDTGVVAGFEQEEQGLRFRLPWLRPSFLPRETMPILVDLATNFDLRLPSSASTVRDLEELWQKGNLNAVRLSRDGLPFMSRERSDRWWLYQSQKQDLHRRLGEDIFVPTLAVAGRVGRNNDLQLHITWTDAVPLVIPECDLVTLVVGRRPSEFKIRGTASYETVRRALEPYLASISVKGLGDVPLLPPERASDARRVFRELPTSDFDHVDVDPPRWVDVSPQTRQ